MVEEILQLDIEPQTLEGALMLEALEILEILDIRQIEIQEFKEIIAIVQGFKEDIAIMIIPECTQELAVERNLRDHIILAVAPEVVLLYTNVHQEAATIVLTELPVLQEVIARRLDQVL